MEPRDRLKTLIDYAWMGLEETDLDYINPFDLMSQDDKEAPDLFLLNMLRQPKYFPLTCKLLLGIEIMPFQNLILNEVWYRSFPIILASRGASKSFTIALYAFLRALFLQGRKIVVTGSGFRQAKSFMGYVESFWYNSPIIQDLMKGGPFESGPKRDNDRWTVRLGYSTITALPLGNGEKIRGERANDTIADEFSSISPDIFEQVIGGFSVVPSSPVDRVKEAASLKKMKELGLLSEEKSQKITKNRIKNQQILMGTAYYAFNHFAKYHERWKKFIESKGNLEILKESMGESVDFEFPKGFNYKDFSIIRLPVELLPEEYFDMAQVAKAKMANTNKAMYPMEYQCIFSKDTDGFFKASLIQSCTASEQNVEKWGEKYEFFAPVIKGSKNKKYIFGVDVASERDNFAIAILELNENHRRVVYSWVMNRARHRALIGKDDENDFYVYCARKIRDLMKVFPTEHIVIDSGGGGIAIEEALHSKNNLREGEVPIWPVVEEKEKPTDDFPGLHILYMFQFSQTKMVAEANHGMKKDMENKMLIFPHVDALSLVELYDNDVSAELEECVKDIEEMKNELTTIVHTQTPNGTERFDTPEIKIAGSKKGRQLKDRYSALLMANAIARGLEFAQPLFTVSEGHGGFIDRVTERGGPMYHGPDWFTKSMNETSKYYGFAR